MAERPRGRARRIVGRVAVGTAAGIALLALVAAGLFAWTVHRSFPQTDGETVVPGLRAEATVQRDDHGIPTITASTSEDLFFAQGYVHAQDRFWEMDFRRHVTSGRLSELFGASQLETDKFLRTLGWREVAEQEVEALGEEELGYYQAYADGVNAYLDEHGGADLSLEYAVLGLQNPGYEPEQWTPADSVAWLKAMAWDLRDNLSDETERGKIAADFSTAELEQLYPEYPFGENPVIVPSFTGAEGRAAGAQPTGVSWREVAGPVEAVSALVGDAGEGIGSNSWVVSGEHTESGLPLLANDPHLGAEMPSTWYQVGLRCGEVDEECPFDVAGFSFSGLPGVVIGHNDRIAWGFTNLTTDVADLYVERLQGDAAWHDGVLEPLQTRTETFKVAGGEDVRITVRSTRHGPILSDLAGDYEEMAADPPVSDAPDPGEYAVSLRWTALDPGTAANAIFAMNRARDHSGFVAAAKTFDVPAQNLVYADVEGNIAYQAPGRLPIRGAGDGWLPQPGWDSAYDWQGYIPFSELPAAVNPEEGYIVTANNAIVGPDYPYFNPRDWAAGFRAARITELLQGEMADGPVDAAAMRRIQADRESWIGRRLAQAISGLSAERTEVQGALNLLADWDGQNDADSAAAAYANVLWDRLVRDLFADRGAPTTGQGRLFVVVGALLDDPGSPWWRNEGIGVDGRDDMLLHSADAAYDELVELQGGDPSGWNWGGLHAITLRNGSFGSSGVAPIEALFNRGPYPVGGGSEVVDATGWNIGEGYQTTTVPSMRMVVDLADPDASSWQHLTGQSGHAYHPNYVDQVEGWARAEQFAWPFTPAAVDAGTTHTLRLLPASATRR